KGRHDDEHRAGVREPAGIQAPHRGVPSICAERRLLDYFRNQVKPMVLRFKAPSTPPGAAFILVTASLSADSWERDSSKPSLRRRATGSSRNCRRNARSRLRRSSSWPRLYMLASPRTVEILEP